MASTPKYNSNALAALIAGIVGFLGLAPIAWPIAGILGKSADVDFEMHGDTAGGGRWMATFGRVLGWVWAGIVAVGIGFIYAQLWV